MRRANNRIPKTEEHLAETARAVGGGCLFDGADVETLPLTPRYRILALLFTNIFRVIINGHETVTVLI